MFHNIIYIDDNEFEHFNVEILVTTHSKCSLTCFFKGQEALDYLAQRKDDRTQIPDIIFLDLSMPDFTGWDFLNEFSKIREEFGKHPHIYILSSTTDEESVNRSKEYPFIKRFLAKPLTANIFQDLLKGIIDI